MAETTPVTSQTGFLGAGKTTLLNNLVSDPSLARTAVLVNEFGGVGIDHLLVRKRDGAVHPSTTIRVQPNTVNTAGPSP